MFGFNFDCFHSDWYLRERRKIEEKYKRIHKIETDPHLTDGQKNRLLAHEDYLALRSDWDKVGEDFEKVFGKALDKYR